MSASHVITEETIREALHKLSRAESLAGSPLLELELLGVIARLEQVEASTDAGEWLLSRLLDRVSHEALSEARAADEGPVPPSDELAAIEADFAANSLQREALGLLRLRYFGEERYSHDVVAERLGLSRRTLRRRIAHGCRLLAERLRQEEWRAAGSAPTTDQLQAPPDPAPSPHPGPARNEPPAFVGRVSDLASITEALEQHRVVCILGPGGVGKTRLAAELLTQRRRENQHPAWQIDVSSLLEPGELDAELMRQLETEVHNPEGTRRAVVTAIGKRSCLLVLDGCEHWPKECAEFVESLLEGCPALRILLTSREPLPLHRAQYIDLAPLEMDDVDHNTPIELLMQHEAPKLLLIRIREARPDIDIASSMAPFIVSVCRRLDGLPLALELAAARAADHSLGKLASNVWAQLAPAREGPDGPASPLRSTIAWSYDALLPAEQRLFACLSVFTAGFTPAMVEGICFELPDQREQAGAMLARIRSKSLIQALESPERYIMLETLRTFAAERLEATGDTERLRHRHASYFGRRSQEIGEMITQRDGELAMQELARNRRDYLAAMAWSIGAGRSEEAQTISSALGHLWSRRGPFEEGLFWISRCLEMDEPANRDLDTRTELLIRAGELHWKLGDLDRAREHYESALHRTVASADRRVGAGILRHLGNLEDDAGRPDRARRLHERALALYKELDDDRGVAATLNNLGLLDFHAGRYAEAEMQLEESLRRFRALDDSWAVGVTLFNLGNVAYDMARYELAERRYADSLAIAESLDDLVGVGTAMRAMGNLAAELGDYVSARVQLRQALNRFDRAGARKQVAECIESLAQVELLDGRAMPAVRHFAAAGALREDIGIPVPRKDRREQAAKLGALRRVVGEERFAQAWQAGRTASWKALTRALPQI